MPTVQDQPAIKRLMEKLIGAVGKPVLAVRKRQEELVHSPLNLPVRRHPFTGTHKLLDYMLGVLTSETLTEDGENHPGQLGIPLDMYTEMRQENRSIIDRETGPLWVSAKDERLCTYFGGNLEVHVGAEAIVDWINSGGLLQDLERLENICQLANALPVQLNQWQPLAQCIDEHTAKLLAQAREKHAEVQLAARNILQKQLRNDALRVPTEEYGRIAERITTLTGIAPSDPLTFPAFSHPASK